MAIKKSGAYYSAPAPNEMVLFFFDWRFLFLKQI